MCVGMKTFGWQLLLLSMKALVLFLLFSGLSGYSLPEGEVVI